MQILNIFEGGRVAEREVYEDALQLHVQAAIPQRWLGCRLQQAEQGVCTVRVSGVPMQLYL